MTAQVAASDSTESFAHIFQKKKKGVNCYIAAVAYTYKDKYRVQVALQLTVEIALLGGLM